MTQQKVVVLGLDGASPDVLEAWAHSGLMPNLAALMKRGSSGQLRSTLPYITPLAWPSIYTGAGPGKHGLMGFRNRVPGTYRWQLNSFLDVRRAPVWDLLAAEGARSAVLFVPFTYPAQMSRGVMISGAFGPGKMEPQSVHPTSLRDGLLQRFEGTSLMAARKQPDSTLGELAQRMVSGVHEQNAAMEYVLSREHVDFTFVVWHDTDKAAHSFWHHSELPHPAEDSPMAKVYAAVDEGIGRVLSTIGGDPLVIVCSDHGTYPIRHRIQTHVWLAREGFLQVKPAARSVSKVGATWRRLPRSMRQLIPLTARKKVYDALAKTPERPREDLGPVEWSETRAYVGPGTAEAFFLNLEGREPGGIVTSDQAEEVTSHLVERLLAIETPSGPAIEKAWRRDELFRGPASELGPDLVAETALGTMFAPSVKKLANVGSADVISSPKRPKSEAERPRPLGYHRREGAVVISGPGVRVGGKLAADVADITPTILRYWDAPIPEDLDGRVIEDAFVNLPAPRTGPSSDLGDRGEGGLTPQEEADVAEHLKALGYLE